MFGLSSQNANEIYTLEIPGRAGVIGLSACPGVRLDSPKRGSQPRHLKRDIAGFQEWGATGIVTLNQEEELHGLGLGDLGHQLMEAGFSWRHLPIEDMNVPEPEFEDTWQIESQQICASLAAGERIVIHCLAGLGRTGMIAARLLVDMGMGPERAIIEVRRVRARAIQTTAQADYVHQFGKKTSADRWSRLQGRQTSVNRPISGGQNGRGPGDFDMKGFGT